jgi:hypothetical protein
VLGAAEPAAFAPAAPAEVPAVGLEVAEMPAVASLGVWLTPGMELVSEHPVRARSTATMQLNDAARMPPVYMRARSLSSVRT